MKLALLFAAMTALGAPVIGAGSGALDVPTMLTSYGIAAPFAALCFWQMQRVQSENVRLTNQITALQNDAVARERDFAARLAPLLYDGALLYKQGNDRLTQRTASDEHAQQDKIEELNRHVTDLLQRLGEGEGR